MDVIKFCFIFPPHVRSESPGYLKYFSRLLTSLRHGQNLDRDPLPLFRLRFLDSPAAKSEGRRYKKKHTQREETNKRITSCSKNSLEKFDSRFARTCGNGKKKGTTCRSASVQALFWNWTTKKRKKRGQSSREGKSVETESGRGNQSRQHRAILIRRNSSRRELSN